ncbi:MAG TPA: hypothetical protein VGL48_07705 [Acidimicrobiales bacterium]|jgi:hypothetical protein
MNALVWRLHRNQACLAGAVLVAVTVLLLITGLGGRQIRSDLSIADLIDATVVVPLLFGLFWGAPLLAKEFEEGTHNLAWTQGITRRSWFMANTRFALLAAAIWGGALGALITWWQAKTGLNGGRFETANAFDIQGVAPAAYSVFAVALGIAAGTVFKRVPPAMATTLTAFVVLRVGIQKYLRPHYMSPHSLLIPLSTAKVAPPAGTWAVSGRQTSSGFLYAYQPASRFWAFQGIEAGIYLGFSVALVVVACRLVMTRDA